MVSIRWLILLARWFVYPQSKGGVCGLSLITCDSFAVRTLASRDFLLFVSFDLSGRRCPPHHLLPRTAAAVIYRFATRLKARDNKAPGKRVSVCPAASVDCYES